MFSSFACITIFKIDCGSMSLATCKISVCVTLKIEAHLHLTLCGQCLCFGNSSLVSPTEINLFGNNSRSSQIIATGKSSSSSRT